MSTIDYERLYEEADRANGLPPGMTKAIAMQETGHIRDEATRNRVRSPANAYGHMQFIPATGKRYGLNTYQDLTDPVKSISAGGRYLGDLYRQFGRPDLTAAAYNAGENRRSLREGRIPAIPETQKYVRNVMSNLASVQHAHSMLQKYSPSFAQRAMDFFVPPAYGADQPQGQGVMQDADSFGTGLQQITGDKQDDFAAGLQQIINSNTNSPQPEGDDFTKGLQQIISGAPQQSAQPQQSGMSPTAQAATRVGARVLTNPVDLMTDALFAGPKAVAWGVNKLRPGTIDVPSVRGMVDKGLEAVGVNPVAQSPGERALTAGLTAATTAPLMGPASVGNVVSQGLGAAASSAAVDATQAAGVGLPGQIAAGVISGAVPAAGAGIVSGIKEAGKRAAAPFTTGGKEAIAGRILNKQASAPMSSLGRAAGDDFNQGYLPGSTPTLAEVTQDPGIARLQRVLPSSKVGMDAGIDQVNAVRVTQLDDAIHDVLNRVNKAPKGGRGDILDAVRDVKQRIGQQFEQQLIGKGIDPQQLPVAPNQTTDRLRGLLRQHEGNANLESLIRSVGSQLGNEAPSFRKLWNMRQSLDDAIYEKWAVSSKASQADMKRLGDQIRGAMNADLVAAVPEFQPFLSRYARMSRAEGRLTLGRKLGEKVENASRNIARDGEAYGDRAISGAKLDNLDIAGAEKRAGAKLSKAQREAFNAAREEKRRANILTSGGAPGNSATAQNQALDQLIADDILGGLLGDKTRTGFAGWLRNAGQTTAGGAVGLLTRAAQADIMRMIAAGLIDPKEGARLMQLGQLRGTADFASRLKGAAGQGVLSEIYSNMVR